MGTTQTMTACSRSNAFSGRPLPLQSYRVLDLTNVLAGPFCCHQLAHMGAEVIKIEAPGGGDLARQLGAEPTLNAALMGASFMAQNAGKKSIVLDLKSPDDKATFLHLVRTADVLVENFRPGVMKRLGLDHEALLEVNPALIYCAISGFGQTGPLSNFPAYDQIIQGMSGAMSITGTPDVNPLRSGFPVADTVGGLTAAFAIAAALAEPERRGRFIDVSMLDSLVSAMGWVVSNYLNAGVEPVPRGNDNFTASPSGTFKCADGYLNIAANKQEQFEALADALDIAWVKSDLRFAKREARLQHRAELDLILNEALASDTVHAWWQKLYAVGVPAGPVLSVPDALSLEQLQHRQVISTYEDVPGTKGPVYVYRCGFHLDGEPMLVASPPPALGQHTQEILDCLVNAMQPEGN